MSEPTAVPAEHPAWCVARQRCEIAVDGDAGHHFAQPFEAVTGDATHGLSIAQWTDMDGSSTVDDLRVRLVRRDRADAAVPTTVDYLTVAEALTFRALLDAVIAHAQGLALLRAR